MRGMRREGGEEDVHVEERGEEKLLDRERMSVSDKKSFSCGSNV